MDWRIIYKKNSKHDWKLVRDRLATEKELLETYAGSCWYECHGQRLSDAEVATLVSDLFDCTFDDLPFFVYDFKKNTKDRLTVEVKRVAELNREALLRQVDAVWRNPPTFGVHRNELPKLDGEIIEPGTLCIIYACLHWVRDEDKKQFKPDDSRIRKMIWPNLNLGANSVPVIKKLSNNTDPFTVKIAIYAKRRKDYWVQKCQAALAKAGFSDQSAIPITQELESMNLSASVHPSNDLASLPPQYLPYQHDDPRWYPAYQQSTFQPYGGFGGNPGFIQSQCQTYTGTPNDTGHWGQRSAYADPPPPVPEKAIVKIGANKFNPFTDYLGRDEETSCSNTWWMHHDQPYYGAPGHTPRPPSRHGRKNYEAWFELAKGEQIPNPPASSSSPSGGSGPPPQRRRLAHDQSRREDEEHQRYAPTGREKVRREDRHTERSHEKAEKHTKDKRGGAQDKTRKDTAKDKEDTGTGRRRSRR